MNMIWALNYFLGRPSSTGMEKITMMYRGFKHQTYQTYEDLLDKIL